jgi:hypothetical protein
VCVCVCVCVYQGPYAPAPPSHLLPSEFVGSFPAIQLCRMLIKALSIITVIAMSFLFFSSSHSTGTVHAADIDGSGGLNNFLLPTSAEKMCMRYVREGLAPSGKWNCFNFLLTCRQRGALEHFQTGVAFIQAASPTKL